VSDRKSDTTHDDATWTDADIAREIYGVDSHDFWTWERTIVDALQGRVSLDTALRVVRAAHEAFIEGGRDYDD
jgi:hypothetical protein